MSELFQAFVAKFPPVSMPITLGEDSHHVFGTENEPLTDKLIHAFILPLEEADPDLHPERRNHIQRGNCQDSGLRRQGSSFGGDD
jgi:hypothetical protein